MHSRNQELRYRRKRAASVENEREFNWAEITGDEKAMVNEAKKKTDAYHLVVRQLDQVQ